MINWKGYLNLSHAYDISQPLIQSIRLQVLKGTINILESLKKKLLVYPLKIYENKAHGDVHWKVLPVMLHGKFRWNF